MKKYAGCDRVATFYCLVMVLLFGAAPSLSKADESDLYDFLWLDPDKKVYVLQNKVYRKENTFYANAGYLMDLSSNYTSGKGYRVGAGYYISEEWGVELMYQSYSNTNNDAYKALQQVNGSVPFIRKYNKVYGAMGVWSPFYGKINTFNKIIYFDWSFGLGAGKVETESNKDTVSSPSTADRFAKESYTGILAKTALRVHITKKIHLNIEYMRTTINAPGPTINNRVSSGSWRGHSDAIVGIGFSF
ncbi:MAG: hypothetical protein CME70_17585 [Halobacteriovorax sp.]|nr:hypothetical protein [Halobacteriovorax sp.]